LFAVQAKEPKRVRRCGGRNHGAALGQNVKSLDEFEVDPGGNPIEPFSLDECLQELTVLA
jgi:hypothetical protein